MQIYEKVTKQSFMRDWGRLTDAEWSSYEDWFERYGKDPAYRDAFHRIDVVFEGIGVFVREKLVDIRLVALFIAGATRITWEKYRDIIDEERKRITYPRYWSETEYLYNELMKYMEQHPELKT